MNKWTEKEREYILLQLEEKQLPFSEYYMVRDNGSLQILGSGGFSVIYEVAERKNTNNRYALKVIGFGDRIVTSEMFRSTTDIQKKLDWNSMRGTVLKISECKELLVYMDDKNHVLEAEVLNSWEKKNLEEQRNYLHLQFVLMEKADPVIRTGDDEKKYLYPQKLAEFQEEEIRNLAYDIGSALEFAHKNKILHRDVKLENVFYDAKLKKYKLGDFGIAKLTDNGMAGTIAFTKGYGAPEVVDKLDDAYDETSDIYSYGMMLYVLLNRLKFPNSNNYNVNVSEQYRNGYVVPRPESGSDDFYRIVQKLCQFDPNERYQTMTEVMNDLEKLKFGRTVKYKKETGNTNLILGGGFWIVGWIIWQLTSGFYYEVNFHWLIVLCGFLCVGKVICAAREKNLVVCSTLLLIFGVAAIVVTGFDWIKIILLLLMVLGSGVMTAMIAAMEVIIYSVSCFLPNVEEQFVSQHWIASVMITLSLIFFVQYGSVKERDRKARFFNVFCLRYLWYLCLALYVLLGVDAYFWQKNIVSLAERMPHNWYIRMMLTGFRLLTGQTGTPKELFAVSVCGAVFCIFWIIRENVMKRKMMIYDTSGVK